MKFFGYGIVWDKENNKPLCRFTNGEYETDNERVIGILKGSYEFEGEVIQDAIPDYEEMTKKELMAILDEQGKEYSNRDLKSQLIRLVIE